MSYSFHVRAASKAAAIAAVAAKLDEVAAAQPSHAVDKAQALAAASAFIEVLPEPSDAQDVTVSVNGSVGWTGTWGVDHKVTHTAVGVSAGFARKE